ncbi:MBL fold metallo-hydrolase [Plastoroseomonas hellenica]|uniref:MBL fold metallo-hydrolase n=1 Tax=Plastoroseomonas hellenica TaxID=2687306 RepID=UPI001BA52E4A|nr:MBL fold metallo-hydrolase [Plastoroseomonas hellenica]MBR0644475.1 MBL fold metallo-hydrolase [Plastoroseomonas hellenica]
MKMIQSGTNFARYEIGGLTVVALRDGYVDMPSSRLRHQDDRPFGTELPEQVRLVDGRLRLSVNAFLVIEQGRHILIDTGAADAWEPTMGLLLRALAEAGVTREEIGTVAFTHTHLDHVGGLVAADGSDAFPNLEGLFVPQEEVPLFGRQERLARFRRRCAAFGDGFSLSNSITAVQAHGHEVGHTAFEVVGGGETLLIWGDIVHVPSIQFIRPELTWEFDADQAQARSTRRRILDRAARPGVFVAGAHLDFPGIGSVTRAGQAYDFSPV